SLKKNHYSEYGSDDDDHSHYDNDDHDDDSESIAHSPSSSVKFTDLELRGAGGTSLHTCLTTPEGVKLYRTMMMKYLTILVKVMPGGHVRECRVTGQDTVGHLHNM